MCERDLVDAYTTNTAFVVQRDEPGFGYRFITDELADAGRGLRAAGVAAVLPDPDRVGALESRHAGVR